MAASDANLIAPKGVAYRLTFYLFDGDGDPQPSATGLDSEVSKDGAAFADCTNEATEIGNGAYYLDLTATEMNADTVAVVTKTSTSGAKQACSTIYTARPFYEPGLAQAGAAGTITLQSTSSASDDYYNGQVMVIIAGTGVSQSRTISDYVGSTKVATVATNWTTTPDSTSRYVILGN